MAGGGRAHEGILYSAMDYVDARRDCSDFVLHGIWRLLCQFDETRLEKPFRRSVAAVKHRPSPAVLERAKRTTLNFKYFPNEPGIDSLRTWTENHYILYTAAAYLAGQLYPDEAFINTGETGRQKMALKCLLR